MLYKKQEKGTCDDGNTETESAIFYYMRTKTLRNVSTEILLHHHRWGKNSFFELFATSIMAQ